MKITGRRFKILGGLSFLVAAIMLVLIDHFDIDRQSELPGFGKWIAYFVLITGFVLMMPWKKD
jgi:ABC-type transport system involved in cytochrome c biogenesis permease subunit